MKRITTVMHPRSGEVYAVEVGDHDEILRAAGPLHHSEALGEEELRGWLDNAGSDAAEDATWLRGELDSA